MSGSTEAPGESNQPICGDFTGRRIIDLQVCRACICTAAAGPPNLRERTNLNYHKRASVGGKSVSNPPGKGAYLEDWGGLWAIRLAYPYGPWKAIGGGAPTSGPIACATAIAKMARYSSPGQAQDQSDMQTTTGTLDGIPIDEPLSTQSDDIKLDFWKRLKRSPNVRNTREVTINTWDLYFTYYDNECDQFEQDDIPAISEHAQVPTVIDKLYELRHRPRKEVSAAILEQILEFSSAQELDQDPEPIDQSTVERVIAFCLRVWLMINVREPVTVTASLVSGTSRAEWAKDEQSLVEFLHEHVGLSVPWVCKEISDIKPEDFSAGELRRQLNLKLILTDNLADHLKSTHHTKNTQELAIFFHVPFLQSLHLGTKLHSNSQGLGESSGGQGTESDSFGGCDIGSIWDAKSRFITETLWTIRLLFGNLEDFIELYRSQRMGEELSSTTANSTDSGEQSASNVVGSRTRAATNESESKETQHTHWVIDSSPPLNTADYAYYAQRLEKLKIMILECRRNGYFKKPCHYEMWPLPPSSSTSRSFSPTITSPGHTKNAQTSPSSGSRSSFTAAQPREILSLSPRCRKPSLSGFWRRWLPVRRWHDNVCPRLELLSEVRSQERFLHGYLIVAIFDRRNNIQERIIKFDQKEVSEKELFTLIRKQYYDLYGWRRFFSLKSLDSFRIYECEARKFCSHKRLEEPPREAVEAMAKLYKAYSQPSTWVGPSSVRTAWLTWIDENLNGTGKVPCPEHLRDSPTEAGTLGIELVIDWSGARIAVLMFVAVFASFVVGIVLSVVKDLQTGWTVAAYIVTAAGVLAAVLAILKDIRFKSSRQQSVVEKWEDATV